MQVFNKSFQLHTARQDLSLHDHTPSIALAYTSSSPAKTFRICDPCPALTTRETLRASIHNHKHPIGSEDGVCPTGRMARSSAAL
jgi:hypothetical protein